MTIETLELRHRISAGVLVEVDDRLLLVRHHKPDAYDFWVAPGGGAKGNEDLRDTIRRETREECGFEIEPQQIAYVEDLWNPELRICKVWFVGKIVGGELNASGPDARAEHIVEAQFVAQSELKDRLVFPPVLHEQYWSDKIAGFPSPRYLGIREMKIY